MCRPAEHREQMRTRKKKARPARLERLLQLVGRHGAGAVAIDEVEALLAGPGARGERRAAPTLKKPPGDFCDRRSAPGRPGGPGRPLAPGRGRGAARTRNSLRWKLVSCGRLLLPRLRSHIATACDSSIALPRE